VADVVVIGAGIGGASVAWELGRRGAAVVVLEREPYPGTHATGRSAATTTQSTGSALVRSLAAESRAFLTDPPDGFCEVPLLSRRGVLWAADDPGLALPAGPTLVPITTDDARRLVPLLRPEAAARAVWEPDAADIDVDALLHAYLRPLSVVTGATVTSLRRTSTGWRVGTAAGTVHEATTVVNAAGAWADDVAALAGLRRRGLVPLRRTAFVFPPPAGVDVRPWPLVFDVAGRWYVKPEAGLLLASPADETPTDPCDATADELDVARAVDGLHAAFDLEVRGVRRAWAGLRTFAPDRDPVSGPDPDDPTFVWLAGQGGYGIKIAPALARRGADTLEIG
jgi:D-arginine dehydrogenase